MKVEKVLVSGFLEMNCYILYNGEGCAIIDPGFQPEVISDAIDRLGVKPTHILLTHGHPDHVGAVKELKKKYRCAVALGEADSMWVREPADIPLVGGETIIVGGESVDVISTPGHTRGGVCYHCGDMLFTGDTLFRESVGRTDLRGGDGDALADSLIKLANLPYDAIVYPGHEEPSTLDWERRNNPYIRLCK